MTEQQLATMRQALEALEIEQGVYAYLQLGKADHIEQAITTLRAAIKAAEEPKCNPHPKAPHGFDRNASHSADRYVCECEGWDAYDAGYQAGFEAGIDAPCPDCIEAAEKQEPVAWMDGYRNIYSLEEKAAGCEDAVIPLVPAIQHWSDCAVHNEPAYPKGDCDCGGYTTPPAAPVHDDLADFIAGALGVSRATAYDMMREALKEAAPVQEHVQTTGETNVELGFYSDATSNGQQRQLVGEVEMGQLVGNGPHKSAGNPDAEGAVAVIRGVDEHGPMLGWYKPWINFPVGTQFYTTPPAAQPAYDQTALELCDVCGWKTLIPGDVCLNCEHEAAAQRKWVGLTDEEIIDVIHPLVMTDLSDEQTDYEIAKAIEAKLKEKNGF